MIPASSVTLNTSPILTAGKFILTVQTLPFDSRLITKCLYNIYIWIFSKYLKFNIKKKKKQPPDISSQTFTPFMLMSKILGSYPSLLFSKPHFQSISKPKDLQIQNISSIQPLLTGATNLIQTSTVSFLARCHSSAKDLSVASHDTHGLQSLTTGFLLPLTLHYFTVLSLPSLLSHTDLTNVPKP